MEETPVLRQQYLEEGLASVGNALGVNQFDTLILSLPGIVLEKDEAGYNSKEFPISEITRRAWIDTWEVVLKISMI